MAHQASSNLRNCEYCALPFHKNGIGNHRKWCAQNPFRATKLEPRLPLPAPLHIDDEPPERQSTNEALPYARQTSSPNPDLLSLCVRRTQAGKTFRLIRTIQETLSGNPHTLSIVFTMKLLANTEQTVTRLWDAICASVGMELAFRTVLMVASKKTQDAPFPQRKNLNEALKVKGVRVIICCASPARLAEVYGLVERVDKGKETLMAGSVVFHHDELHKYIACKVEHLHTPVVLDLRAAIERIASRRNSVVQKIYGYTATPGPIFDSTIRHKNAVEWDNRGEKSLDPSCRCSFWKAVERRVKEAQSFEEKDDLDYFGVRDMRFAIREARPGEGKPADYTGAVLLENEDELFRNGATRIFAPASSRTASHDDVRELCFQLSSEVVVVVLNGKDRSVAWRAGKKSRSEDVSSDAPGCAELSERIAEVLQKHELLSRPVIVTGYFCLGMGQTLTTEETGNFTHAILPPRKKDSRTEGAKHEANLYQEAGRITGRCMGWRTFTRTKIWCPEERRDNFWRMERKAETLAGTE